MNRKMANDRGFTLVEVLVAVLVLSIGLLGLAGLQANGLKNNNGAYLRSQANLLAYGIIDRMRANRAAALSTGNPYQIDYVAPPSSVTDCEASGATCTAAEMAAFDLAQWKCQLGKWDAETVCGNLGIEGVLPGGDGRITRNAGLFTVTIQYNEGDRLNKDGDAVDNTTTLSVETRL